jgi:hypothetical protein
MRPTYPVAATFEDVARGGGRTAAASGKQERPQSRLALPGHLQFVRGARVDRRSELARNRAGSERARIVEASTFAAGAVEETP